MNLIDTHTHLFVDAFDEDRNEVIENAMQAGIDKFLLPNIDLDSIDGMIDLSKKYPNNCFPMLGLHPCSVDQNYKSVLSQIESYLTKSIQFCAIGEIGIDLYWDKRFLDAQIDAFKIQIEWAKMLELPIVIHVRDAFDEVFNVIDELNDDRLTGIFHCFTGTEDQAKRIINYGGFKMGLGGVLTFKNSGLDKAISNIELDHFVLETDSPYLAPTPYRGKRNESKYLINVAEKLADIYGKSLDEIAIKTSENANAIFKLTNI